MISMRIKISALLIVTSTILAFVTMDEKYSMHGNARELLAKSNDELSFLSVDQFAKAVVSEDSALLLIDLRSQHDFEEYSIPGSINIPYPDFLKADLESVLSSSPGILFIADDDYRANYAFVLAQGLGYPDCKVLKGGLNEWKKTVSNSSFSGERISARENAVFENRYKAARIVNEYNELPDSAKMQFRKAKEIERKKLDGGCE